MKYILSILLFIPLLTIAQNKQDDSPLSKLGPNYLMIIDSAKVTRDQFQKFNPNTIASLQVLTDTDATNKYGDAAKDGAVIIQTKAVARKRYTSYFRNKSHAYDSLYVAAKSDSAFQYIINDKIKPEKDSEGDLSAINDDLFISLEILTADDLQKKYNISGKSIGVLIKCKKPKDFLNADSKF
ncbi:MAG TPA: hypothetical protein VG367_08325 [Mucilaginibacter sp.]|jgi:hypothetical protein|nr:hypothetical protein [Mucilaginibacter sp.]